MTSHRLAAILGIGLLGLCAAAIPARAQELPVLGEGRCFYADRYAPLLKEGVIFADCDAASITRSGEDVIFSFTNTSRKRETLFRTRNKEGAWQITAVRQQDRVWREASGACEIYRRGGEVSTVTCYTTRGVFRYAANFEVGRGVSTF